MAGRKVQTVGQLIEMLAKFPFNTEVMSNCGACQKGECGGEITVTDMTKQTFGYIELNFNQSWKDVK